MCGRRRRREGCREPRLTRDCGVGRLRTGPPRTMLLRLPPRSLQNQSTQRARASRQSMLFIALAYTEHGRHAGEMTVSGPQASADDLPIDDTALLKDPHCLLGCLDARCTHSAEGGSHSGRARLAESLTQTDRERFGPHRADPSCSDSSILSNAVVSARALYYQCTELTRQR
jgi:hypothetical protein